jgi:hypothetical protein
LKNKNPLISKDDMEEEKGESQNADVFNLFSQQPNMIMEFDQIFKIMEKIYTQLQNSASALV